MRKGVDAMVQDIIANRQKLLDGQELKIDVPEGLRYSYDWIIQLERRLEEEGLHAQIIGVQNRSTALVQLAR